MSHFTTITTKLTCIVTIREAALAIGYTIASESTTVRGWSDQTTRAELVIATGTSYDIGAVRQNGGYGFVCDWTMSRIDQRGFVSRISQAYGRIRVTQAARRKGLLVVQDRVDERGNVQLLLRKPS